MPEEFAEEAAEVAIEAIEERAGGHHQPVAKWVEWASLSTMVMALASAVGGLMAGKTANEAIIDRQKQIADSLIVNRLDLQSEILATRRTIIEATGGTPDPDLLQRIEAATLRLGTESKQAYEAVEESVHALGAHELFAIATTLLSVAITLTGMAVIVKREKIWYLGLCISVCGTAVLFWGLASMGSA
jgi:hypothetical protein